ncbi:hypothetical protein DPMN_067534 [Dreissena polymorpha]|uniref:Uncharacterized protein n=1 Tax=Dreissena polymorpha TaxID=45954 RepID=A0A9D4BSV8_DREPO|nr:hypothetical protein DPMN_067534 [Dreissena polymorpha]
MDDSADTKQSKEMDDIAETATDETANHKDEKYEEGEHFPPTCRKSVDENANTAPTNITTTCFGKTRLKPLLKKFVLRAMMILHSVLAAWRVVISRGDHRF